jgi:hypothetical protein
VWRTALTGLIVGLIVGVVGTFLFVHFSKDTSVGEELADALGCSPPVNQQAAIAHHTSGYSEWAATHAIRILGVGGCETGPATIYMRFSPYGDDLQHALASMHGFGPVCVVRHGLFEGRSLNSGELESLCAMVGGTVHKL